MKISFFYPLFAVIIVCNCFGSSNKRDVNNVMEDTAKKILDINIVTNNYLKGLNFLDGRIQVVNAT